MAIDRYNTKKSSRNTIDVIEIHRNFKNVQKSRRKYRFQKFRGIFFAVISISAFFMLGYAIAALSLPIWAKIMIFILIAFLGLIPGYLVSTLFH
ncbi:TPA: hypothetical protein ENS27_13655 [bacterium]|nr:hypothetical protein [bacterium]